MRTLSRERVARLSREILDGLLRGRSVTLIKEREVVRQAIAQALADEVKRDEEREEVVRRRIAAVRNAPAQGSREWDELFRKWVEEEYVRETVES